MFKHIDPHHTAYSQEDAHEFLMRFLDALSTSLEPHLIPLLPSVVDLSLEPVASQDLEDYPGLKAAMAASLVLGVCEIANS